MSMKPKMGYKRRMERDDAHWVIWSNKWMCWYRAKSQGYTNDPLQAGIFTRDEALTHFEPERPRSHRITEPFPLSVLRSEAEALVVKAKADLATAEERLGMIACKPERVPC